MDSVLINATLRLEGRIRFIEGLGFRVSSVPTLGVPLYLGVPTRRIIVFGECGPLILGNYHIHSPERR